MLVRSTIRRVRSKRSVIPRRQNRGAAALEKMYAPEGAKIVQSDNTRAFNGRLPDISIGADGTGSVAGSVLGVSMAQLKGRTIIIQGQGNNTLDPVAPMVTQRGRLACGAISRE